ncbi:putative protein kinase RLK-Pelle-LRR-III family [Helianthus annuus]|nr:putative protein kinase RLK-Pelle-LRR-III family [Helianthus annuus]
MRRVTMIYQLLVIHLAFTTVVKSSTTIQEFYHEERDALIPFRDSMNSSYNLHGNWTGPPCLNNMSRWTGITCSNSHITQLTLESINLTGTLPVRFLQNISFLSKLSFRNNAINGDLPTLTDLAELETVILSGNRFSGSIPSDYINLHNLTTLELQENEITGSIPRFDQETLTALNLSYNWLSGPIPESKIMERFNRSSFDHNAGLCGRPLEIPCDVSPGPAPSEEDGKKRLQVWSVVMIVAAIVIVPLLVVLCLLCCYRRVQGKQVMKEATGKHQDFKEGVGKKSQWSASTDDPEKTVDLEFFDKHKPIFDLDELLRASAEVLGKGCLGTTYKATLETGRVVAVKRVKEINHLTKKEFEHQMQLLGKLRHENLVEMVSFYYSKEEMLIIHEFIQHGSLFELLHG